MVKKALMGLWVTCVCFLAATHVGLAAKAAGPALPAPWSTRDIGATGVAGSTAYVATGGVFTVNGAGADIWGTSDAFQFVSQSVTGDVTIIARVTSEKNTDTYAKAGVMLRETLAANATDVILDVRPGGGVEFMSRQGTGTATTYISGGTQVLPAWLKLTRIGSTVTASLSTNGTTWSTVGVTTVAMAAGINAGLAVTSHTTSALNTATFDSVSVTAPQPPPGVPTTPSPATGTTGTSITSSTSWTASGATTYDVAFGTTNPPPTAATGLTTASYTPAGLKTSTTYFWQVTARNANGATAGPVWSFTTAAPAIVPPSTPASPNPSSGATGVSSTTSLSFVSTGATSYDISFGSVNPPPAIATGLALPSYTPTALSAGTTYYWRATGRNAGGVTTGPVWSFTTAPATASDIIVYAADVPSTARHGAWTSMIEATAAGGVALGTPDLGVSNPDAPLASPLDYVDVSFTAPAGVRFTLWLRLRALSNSKYNDSLWVQFSDATAAGASVYPLGTTSGLSVNLATDSTGASLIGWGWTNSSYWLTQATTVTFTSSGTHTLRLQTREDGALVDQIVLSPSTYLSTAPGAVTNDNTIVPKANQPPAVPVPLSPVNTATGVGTTPQLTWSATGATTFDVSLGTTSTPALVSAAQTTASYTPAALAKGTVYYWRVVAHNGAGDAVGPITSFTTAADVVLPGTPATPVPASGATAVSTSTTLTWSASGATSYDVNFGTVSPPPTVSSAQTSATFAPGVLAAGTTYFWQIVARSAAGTTAGPIWSFATAAAATGSSGGTTWTVNAGGDLQAAINSAQPGDTIVLQAGATFTGNFVLPNKSGSTFITIRSAAADAVLPSSTTRISPAFSAQLPKIVSNNSSPAMVTAAGAHHYRLLFLEFLANYQGYGDILDLGAGDSTQNTVASIPHDLIIDRVYIHGDVTYGQKRGIGLNSASTSILNSYIAEIKAVGQDSQAICGWNGPGPFVITNNYLEAAGENVLIGGSDPSIVNLVPSDITFTGNYVAKQLAWRTQSWSVKNLFELKNAQRVVVDGNIFEYNWQAGQNGYAVAFTPRNQGGTAPWSVVQQVQFTHNVIRHTASGFNILGTDNEQPSLLTNHITIANNLLVDISAATYGGDGRFMIIGGGDTITVDHNTVFNDGSSTVYAYATPVPSFTFTNNIIPDNAWAFIGDNTAGIGNPTITQYFPNGLFLDGIYAGASPSSYPTGNYFPSSMSAVGFVNLAGGNYRLSSSSLYRLSATDGTDVGCNIDAVNAAAGTKY